jgi:hypothetical protein
MQGDLICFHTCLKESEITVGSGQYNLTVGVALRGHPFSALMRCQTTGGHGGPPLQLGCTDLIEVRY